MRCLRFKANSSTFPSGSRPCAPSLSRRILFSYFVTHLRQTNSRASQSSNLFLQQNKSFHASGRISAIPKASIMATNAPTSDQLPLEELTSKLSSFGLDTLETFSNTYPTYNPIDIYRSHITTLLAPLAGADPKIVYNALAWTQSLDHGDLILPVAALRLKGIKPDALAKDIADKFPESPLIERPVAEGMRLKFTFKPLPLAQVTIKHILTAGDKFGFNPNFGLRDPEDPEKGRKRIIVEFSSPNIAKPFHAGHLRSTIIGGFLAHLYEKAGWDVIRMNYLGDWGKQFGVLASGYLAFGSPDELEANPIGHLFEVYVAISEAIRLQSTENAIAEREAEITDLEAKGEDVAKQKKVLELAKSSEDLDEQARKYFKKMSDGDKDALALWEKFRDLSIVRYRETYARLNVKFDDYSGESQVPESEMEKSAKIMEEKGVTENSDGAIIVDFTKHGAKKLGKAVVQKKDGTALYLTRDIAAIRMRDEKYAFDKMIYVVASQQDLHLQQLFKVVELMGFQDLAKRCVHINFGMVKGMSTRRGTVKFLDDILKDVGETMHNVMKANEEKYRQVEDPEKVADILGISAVMVQDYTGKRVNGYDFSLERMLSFEGDTGPYLQYAHARLSSIVRKAAVPPADLVTANLSLLTEKVAIDLVRSIAQFPDMFIQTLKTQEPVTMLAYLFKMSHALSSSYDHLQVVRSEPDIKHARMALYVAARQVLGNGMRLLGLSPLERM